MTSHVFGLFLTNFFLLGNSFTVFKLKVILLKKKCLHVRIANWTVDGGRIIKSQDFKTTIKKNLY